MARHHELFHFFQKLLPAEELLYHSPFPPHRPFDPSRSFSSVNRCILSLTPTEGVYQALHANLPSKSVLFLHRPFRLDRKRVPHGTLVLASHVRYDELYTTGFNEAFAAEHGVSSNTEDRYCIKGYKDNPQRRIGLVGKIHPPQLLAQYTLRLAEAFEGFDLIHQDPSNPTGSAGALASLNAFTPEVLERVSAAAAALQVPASEVVCLTGAVREVGLDEAKRLGFSVVAVGHRRCELWGLKHFEQLLKQTFPNLELVRVDEPEEPIIRAPKVKKEGGKPSLKKDSGNNAAANVQPDTIAL